MAKKPQQATLVTERSIFGDLPSDIIDNPQQTATYIGGYSDKRREIDLALRDGKRVSPLKHRLHIVPDQRPNGVSDGRKIAEFQSKGYSVAKWDDLEAEGYELSAAFQRGPDGTARIGDSVVMIAPAEAAARNLRDKLRRDNANLEAITSKAGPDGEPAFTLTVESDED